MRWYGALSGLVWGLVLAGGGVWAEEPADSAARPERQSQPVESPQAPRDPHPTFERDIAPLLATHCLACHGEDVRRGGLDLRRRFLMLEGGDSGPAIEPGHPDKSLLLEMVHEDLMPPPEADRLSKAHIQLLTQWIAAGAPLSGDAEAPLESTGVESLVTEEDRSFWSFQPPIRPTVPPGQPDSPARTPIDHFLLARLEQQGLAFNPEASRRVLIRRVYFDLHGLPPTPEQIQDFVADERPDAYERLVDQLLDSPRYGERWGRHWLDVAGYADSDGYLEADRERPEAWRYRDYVIRGLNQDKPYNRFLLEQLAGDELTDWRQAPELTDDMRESLVATGFLRTASDPTYGNYKDKPECYKVMADTLQIISSGLMGVTLQCARCHSHKADPFSHRDYYRLHAVLLSAYDPDRWLVSLERAIPLATDSEVAKIEEHNRLLQERLAYLQQELSSLTERQRDLLLQQHFPELTPEAKGKLKAALLVEPGKRSDEQKQVVAQHPTELDLSESALEQKFPDYAHEAGLLKQAIASEQALQRSFVQARGLMDLYPEPRQAYLLRRGDHNTPGRAVTPGVPEVLAPAGFELAIEPGYKTTGRRLAFANWLVSPTHPLTARVHVNRIWAHHFGRGIVETLDDFGRSGALPTHPELLDWLACEFMEQGWSQKSLHRLILTSAVYRQTSDFDDRRRELDPENKLLSAWPPQRHEGEVIRDSVLQLAGRLNPEQFGSPVPVHRQKDGLIVTADDPQGNRRSLYIKVRRSQPLTLLEQFDTPRMEINCTQRTEAIVATQALTLMNSEFLEKNAAALRDRLFEEAGSDDSQRIHRAYELVFGRFPSESEREAVEQFLSSATQEYKNNQAAKPDDDHTHSPRENAWADVCLVLLNSNEFLYVH